MYKIILLPTFGGKSIEIESEIIFENKTQLYFPDMDTVIIDYRSFTIKADYKGIGKVTYFYDFV